MFKIKKLLFFRWYVSLRTKSFYIFFLLYIFFSSFFLTSFGFFLSSLIFYMKFFLYIYFPKQQQHKEANETSFDILYYSGVILSETEFISLIRYTRTQQTEHTTRTFSLLIRVVTGKWYKWRKLYNESKREHNGELESWWATELPKNQ